MIDKNLISEKRNLYNFKLLNVISTEEEIDRLKLKIQNTNNTVDNQKLHLLRIYKIEIQVELKVLDYEINKLAGIFK